MTENPYKEGPYGIEKDHSLGKIERGIKGFSIDLLIEIAVFFDTSLDYIVLGREMQIDVTKQALGSIINQLVNLEKKL